MLAQLAPSAHRILRDGVAAAMACGGDDRDYRATLCRWEDDLFARFPDGHEILDEADAEDLIDEVFAAFGRPRPRLQLVAGFDDPRVGGFADVAANRIVIEAGCLYRFLILHESAHLLVPADRQHGAAFTYVLQILYRTFIGIPEDAVRELLKRHRLPMYTAMPNIAPVAIAA